MSGVNKKLGPIPLWDYAVDLYGRAGVSEVCLDLQDRCDLDVDVLLFAVWSAAAGPGQLDADAFRDLIRITSTWREDVLKPLRSARRASINASTGLAGGSAATITDKLQAAELAAERVELELLEQWAGERAGGDPPADPAAAAASNMVAYLAAAGVETRAAATGIRTLLAAAFQAG